MRRDHRLRVAARPGSADGEVGSKIRSALQHRRRCYGQNMSTISVAFGQVPPTRVCEQRSFCSKRGGGARKFGKVYYLCIRTCSEDPVGVGLSKCCSNMRIVSTNTRQIFVHSSTKVKVRGSLLPDMQFRSSYLPETRDTAVALQAFGDTQIYKAGHTACVANPSMCR